MINQKKKTVIHASNSFFDEIFIAFTMLQFFATIYYDKL